MYIPLALAIVLAFPSGRLDGQAERLILVGVEFGDTLPYLVWLLVSPDQLIPRLSLSLEAVQNAAKHAGPHARIWIRLHVTADLLHLEVRDDGGGFDVDRADDGVGLQSMRDRLGAVGGHVDVISQPDEGTLIAATIPIRSL